MKRISPTTLLFAFIFLLNACQSGNSGKTYKLKMRLAEGDHFEQNVKMDMRMHYNVAGQSMNMRMGMDVASFFDILNSTPEEKKLKMTYSRSKMTMDMGQLSQGMDVDSIMNRASNKIIGKSITIVLSKDNEIKDVTGSGLLEEDNTDPQSKEFAKKMFSKEQINGLFGMVFNMYPDKPIAVGDSWTKENKVNIGDFEMKMKMKCTLVGVSGNSASIAVDGTINGGGTTVDSKAEVDMKGTQKGTMTVDLTSGYLQKGKYTMAINADISVKGQKVPMTMDADYTMSGK